MCFNGDMTDSGFCFRDMAGCCVEWTVRVGEGRWQRRPVRQPIASVRCGMAVAWTRLVEEGAVRGV